MYHDTPNSIDTKQEEFKIFVRKDEKAVQEHDLLGSKGYDMFYSLMRE